MDKDSFPRCRSAMTVSLDSGAITAHCLRYEIGNTESACFHPKRVRYNRHLHNISGGDDNNIGIAL